MTWDDVALWAVLGSAPGQVLFVLLYGLFTPWWRELIGRALLWKSSALALVMSMIFAAYVWDIPIPRPVAAVVYGLTFIGVYWQLVAFLWIRFNRETRAEQAGLWHVAARRLRRSRV